MGAASFTASVGAVMLQMQNGQLAAVNLSKEIVWTPGGGGSPSFLQIFDGYDGVNGGAGFVPYAPIA